MDGGTVVTVSGTILIDEATGFVAVGGAAGAAAVKAAIGAATAAGTEAESRAAQPSLPRKLIKEALPDGRLAASLTAVDSTIVFFSSRCHDRRDDIIFQLDRSGEEERKRGRREAPLPTAVGDACHCHRPAIV